MAQNNGIQRLDLQNPNNGKGKLKVETSIFSTSFYPVGLGNENWNKINTLNISLLREKSLCCLTIRWSYSIWVPAWYLNKTLWMWYNHRCIIWRTLPSRAWNERTSWISPAGHSSSSIGMWTSACRGMYRRINRGTTWGSHRIEKFWMVKFTCIPIFTLSRF